MTTVETFTCPRCGATSQERFYGPCSSCRAQLRAKDTEHRPDPHFAVGERLGGKRAIDFKTCKDPTCPIPACGPNSYDVPDDSETLDPVT